MKIGFVSQPGYSVLPPIGSLEIWTHELARRLIARGHEVTIYASRSDGGAAETTKDGVRYHFVDHGTDARIARVVRPLHRALPRDRAFFSSPAYQLLYWRRAAQRIAEGGCQLIHVYNYSQALPFMRRANRAATVVLHMQCEWLNQLARPMLARRLEYADRVLGCSEYITRKIARRFPEFSGKLGTIYNGIEPGGEPPARRPGAPPDGVKLLHVGRISPEKGHHVLFRAFNQLVEDHPEVTLTIVGEESPIPIEMAVDLFGEDDVEDLRRWYDGSYLEQLKAGLSERALERVRFAGRVSHDETTAYYRDSDVFAFPSIFEAMPIPPVEAMAQGLPVVATSVGGTVESVRDGETGLLVPRGDADALRDALHRLIVSAELRETLGAAGRRRAVERFSWESVCDAFLALAATREATVAA